MCKHQQSAKLFISSNGAVNEYSVNPIKYQSIPDKYLPAVAEES